MPVTTNEQLNAILQFLVGVRHPQIRMLMALRGFEDGTYEEGWELFNVASGRRLAYTHPFGEMLAEDDTKRLIQAIDDDENAWFPVVDATLTRHFPRVRDELFKNISQTQGPQVVVSVGTLLERIKELQAQPTAESTAVLALLERRGFTQRLREQMYARVEQVRKSSEITLPEIEPNSAAERDAALTKAWDWYREWRQIARTVVRRRDMLMRLGLSD